MSKKGSTYVEDSNIGFYSSMSEHIDLRLIKGKKAASRLEINLPSRRQK